MATTGKTQDRGCTERQNNKSPQKRRGPKPGTMHIDKRAGRLLDDPIFSEGNDDQLLTTQELAKWLGCSVEFLEIQRGKETGPPFVRVTPNMVRYRRGGARDWLRSREVRSTAEYRKKPTGR